MAHAPLSPSAAHRWLVCPASVKEAANTVSADTDASKEGTAAHEVMNLWLTTGAPPALGVKLSNGLEVTQSMLDTAKAAVDYVTGYIAGKQHVLMAEEKVQIASFYGLEAELLHGTADVIVLTPEELLLADLKAGYVEVQAEDNVQLILYATGVMEEMGWMYPKVRLAIIQPRNGGVKEWVLTKEELLSRAEALKPKVVLAASDDAPYVPSEEGCRYCPAAGVCRALQQNAIEVAQREFSTVDALVAHISPEELSSILAKADLIEAAVKAAREHALKLLSLGQEVPGWKMVEGRKNRVWKDEEKAIAAFRMFGYNEEEFAPRKMLSPAQAEKLLKDKKVMADLIETPAGKATLAPATDKRPALQPMSAIDTGNLLD